MYPGHDEKLPKQGYDRIGYLPILNRCAKENKLKLQWTCLFDNNCLMSHQNKNKTLNYQDFYVNKLVL